MYVRTVVLCLIAVRGNVETLNVIEQATRLMIRLSSRQAAGSYDLNMVYGVESAEQGGSRGSMYSAMLVVNVLAVLVSLIMYTIDMRVIFVRVRRVTLLETV